MADETDALPLLEFALTRLYEKCKAEQILTYEAYEQIGELKGAIDNSAEAIFQELKLGMDGETVLRRVLWAVSKSGGGNRGQTVASQSALLAEFPEDSPARKLISSFIEKRLLVRDGDSIRVAHEALLNHWPTAKAIIDSFLSSMQLRDRLIERAAEWQANTNDPSLLLPAGLPLSEGQDLLERMGNVLKLNAELVIYIEASLQAEQDLKEAELVRIQEEQAKELAREKEKTEHERRLTQQQTELAEERQEKAVKLQRMARRLIGAAAFSLTAAIVAGWQWKEAQEQKTSAEMGKAELAKTLAACEPLSPARTHTRS